MDIGYAWAAIALLLLQNGLILLLWRRHHSGQYREKSQLAGAITVTPMIDNTGRATCILTVDRRDGFTIRETTPTEEKDAGPAGEKPAMPSRMSHDLNQPLNSIKMTAGGILFLLKQGNQIPEEELRQCLQEISCQADRMAALIKTLKSG
ncbi:MAG TPA: histidine kinase dimerization/phospho-acceptor domain-containing protein [Patescibacteria group bacterium]|nr:histidine kinase dimerization/phospho-acceptor domain-containing protein [Patescibacteria group bacterium]